MTKGPEPCLVGTGGVEGSCWTTAAPHPHVQLPISLTAILTLQDRVYHWTAFLFYFCAFILEVWATIIMQHGDYFTYLENVFATVRPPVNLPMFTAPTAH